MSRCARVTAPQQGRRLYPVQIYTSSERRVTASAEIFTAALVEDKPSRSSRAPEAISSSPASTSGFSGSVPPTPRIADYNQVHLIIRKDLLDDSNAAKDLTDEVKKRLKILLRPGESERRPELAWPKDEKEPAEVVKVRGLSEWRQLRAHCGYRKSSSCCVRSAKSCTGTTSVSMWRQSMNDGAATMSPSSSENGGRSCSRNSATSSRRSLIHHGFVSTLLTAERGLLISPMQVSELYDTIKYCALHHRAFLFTIFNPDGLPNPEPSKDRQLHTLYARAKLLFDLVAPQEYGIDDAEKCVFR